MRKIPKFFMKKWKDENDILYEEYVFENTERARKNMEKVLIQTNLTESEYMEMLERNLLDKAKILRRDKHYENTIDNNKEI